MFSRPVSSFYRLSCLSLSGLWSLLIPQCQEVIEDSYMVAKEIADDVDFHGCLFDEFGKGLIKKSRTSPDAFIQLALQLAQFRVCVCVCVSHE